MKNEIMKVDDHVIDAIIETQLAQVTRYEQTGIAPQISAAEAYRLYRLEQRRQEDLRHQRANDAFGRLAIGLGVAGVLGVVLLALFVALIKTLSPAPTPPPVINPSCWLFCRSEVPDAVQ